MELIVFPTPTGVSIKESLKSSKYFDTEYWSLSLPFSKTWPLLNLTLLSSRVNFLIWGSIKAFFPDETTWIFVFDAEYPIPVLITLTSDIWPLLIIALNSAPVPEPVTIRSGTE